MQLDQGDGIALININKRITPDDCAKLTLN